jgi:hypothetical protein
MVEILEYLHQNGSPFADWFTDLNANAAAKVATALARLGAGAKKRQQQDINTALVHWQDYKRRKKEESYGPHT